MAWFWKARGKEASEQEVPTRKFALLPPAAVEATVHTAPTREFPAHVDPGEVFARAERFDVEPAAREPQGTFFDIPVHVDACSRPTPVAPSQSGVRTASGVEVRLPPPAPLAVERASLAAARRKER